MHLNCDQNNDESKVLLKQQPGVIIRIYRGLISLLKGNLWAIDHAAGGSLPFHTNKVRSLRGLFCRHNIAPLGPPPL